VVEEMNQTVRKPSAGMAAVRIVLITVITTLFCFAIALFFSIVGVFLADIARHGRVDMSIAYRHIAFPIAVGVLVIAFVSALVSEIRRYRRARADYIEWKRAA
jgi:uncharacterized membrane protein